MHYRKRGKAPDPPVVSIKVTGKQIEPRERTKRLLGKTTWTVWVFLIGARGPDGRTVARIKTIMKKRNLSRFQVKWALAKLRAVGLVEDVGFEQYANHRKKQWVRRVLGDYRNDVVYVPIAVRNNLRLLIPQGRPTSASRQLKRSTPTRKRSTPSNGKGLPPVVNSTAEKSSVPRHLKKGLPLLGSTIGEMDSPSPFPSERKKKNRPGEAPGQCSRFVEEVCMATDHEAIARLCQEGGGVIPRHPSTKLMACARLPSPPSIPEDASELQAVWLMVLAYRGSVEAHYDEPCFIFATGDIKQSKYYRSLTDAAETLRDLDIAPGAWAAFSCDVWKEYAQGKAKGKPPPVNFVFSSKRIHEKRGWFRREQGSYSGGRVLFSVEHREVMSRHQAVVQLRRRVLVKLAKEHGEDIPTAAAKDALTALVEEWFPGGYDEWLQRARERGEDDQQRLARMVAEGQYVWG